MIYARWITARKILIDGTSYAEYFAYVMVNDQLPFFLRDSISVAVFYTIIFARIVYEKRSASMWLTPAQISRKKTAVQETASLSSLTSGCCLLPCTFVILQNRLDLLLRPVTFELYVFIENTPRFLSLSLSLSFWSFCPSSLTSGSWKSGAYIIGPNFSERSDSSGDTDQGNFFLKLEWRVRRS